MIATIYHNPRCSKSRQTLALLESNECDVQIIEYLQHPPTPAELTAILKQLGCSPQQLMRRGEDDYKAARAKLATMNDSAAIDWLCRHPKVIERPIVVTATGARIGRPPEAVLEIIQA